MQEVTQSRMAEMQSTPEAGGSSKASTIEALPMEVLAFIFEKADLYVEELLLLTAVSKAFQGAARVVHKVQASIDCITCACSERSNVARSISSFLEQARRIKILDLAVLGTICDDCVDLDSSGCDWEAAVARWIDLVKNDLTIFCYEDSHEGTDQVTFNKKTLESLVSCKNLKQVSLQLHSTARLTAQTASSPLVFSLPGSIVELALRVCKITADEYLGILSSLPLLTKLSLSGRVVSGHSEKVICLSHPFLEAIDLDMDADHLTVTFVSLPKLQRLSYRYKDPNVTVNISLAVRHKLPHLRSLTVANVSWEQTILLLKESPHLEEFAAKKWPEDETGILTEVQLRPGLFTILGQLAKSNCGIKRLWIETAHIRLSGFGVHVLPKLEKVHLAYKFLDESDLQIVLGALKKMMLSAPGFSEITLQAKSGMFDGGDMMTVSERIREFRRKFPRVKLQVKINSFPCIPTDDFYNSLRAAFD